MAIPICEIHKIEKILMPESNSDFYCENCYMVFQAKSLLKAHNYKLLEKGFVAVSVEDLKFINLTYSNLRTKEECKKGEDILNKYLLEAKK